MKLPGGFVKNGVKLNNNNHVKQQGVNKNVVNYNNNVVKMQHVKSKPVQTGACLKYVCSKVTLYYNSRIELKWNRALHHCSTCDYGVGKDETTPCGAIHYGMCLPVVDRLFLPKSAQKPPGKSEAPPKSPQAAVWPTTAAAPVHPAHPVHVGVAPTSSSHSKSAARHFTTSTSPSSHTSKVFIQVLVQGEVLVA